MSKRKLKKRVKYLLKNHTSFAINECINPDEVWFGVNKVLLICFEPEFTNTILLSYKEIKLSTIKTKRIQCIK